MSSVQSEFYEILPFLFVIYGIMIVIGLANYIISGIGILKISANHGKPHGWLGFIPIANRYQIGAVSGELEFSKRRMKSTGLWMVLIPMITSVVFSVFYIGLFVYIFIGAMSFDYSSVSPFLFLMEITGVVFAAILLMSVGTTIYTIIYLMALFKIFSAHYSGPRSVFYMLLSTFIPLAAGILLIKAAGTQIINPPEYMLNAPYGTPPNMSGLYSPNPLYTQNPPRQYSPAYPPYPPFPPQQYPPLYPPYSNTSQPPPYPPPQPDYPAPGSTQPDSMQPDTERQPPLQSDTNEIEKS